MRLKRVLRVEVMSCCSAFPFIHTQYGNVNGGDGVVGYGVQAMLIGTWVQIDVLAFEGGPGYQVFRRKIRDHIVWELGSSHTSLLGSSFSYGLVYIIWSRLNITYFFYRRKMLDLLQTRIIGLFLR